MIPCGFERRAPTILAATRRLPNLKPQPRTILLVQPGPAATQLPR
jgi:hypothetical protein